MFLVLWVFKVEKSSREWSTRQTEGPLSCLAPLKPQQTRSPSGSRVQGFCVSQLPIRFPLVLRLEENVSETQNFSQVPALGKNSYAFYILQQNASLFVFMWNILQHLPVSRSDRPGGCTLYPFSSRSPWHGPGSAC